MAAKSIEDKMRNFVRKIEREHSINFVEINITKKVPVGFKREKELIINYVTND